MNTVSKRDKDGVEDEDGECMLDKDGGMLIVEGG
jgi:hypothetical protein